MTYKDEDDRVIVNMDVDGMPWHDKRVRREKRPVPKNKGRVEFTRSESRLYTWYSVLYGMAIAGVFAVTWILFILFCTKIWFR